MIQNVNKDTSPIGRVKCVVASCHFNEAGNYCMAEHIEIHPPNAKDSETTDCATYTSK
jgi:hypothetical protein